LICATAGGCEINENTPAGWGCTKEVDSTQVCPGQSDLVLNNGCPRFWNGIEEGSDGWSSLALDRWTIRASDLRPTPPVTYFEMRTIFYRPGEGDYIEPDTSGVLCAEATDEEAYVGSFNALTSEVGWLHYGYDPDGPRWIAWNRGDEVGAVTSVDDLLVFLGTDDLSDILYRLGPIDGWWWRVGEFEVGAARPTGGSIELILAADRGGVIELVRGTVGGEGNFEESARAVTGIDCRIWATEALSLTSS